MNFYVDFLDKIYIEFLVGMANINLNLCDWDQVIQLYLYTHTDSNNICIIYLFIHSFNYLFLSSVYLFLVEDIFFSH